MEQHRKTGNDSVKVAPRTVNVRSNLGPKGFILFILAMTVLLIGFVGYLEFDRLVKPYMKEYLCCVPAIILAIILIFLGFTTQITTVKRVQVQRPAEQVNTKADSKQTQNRTDTSSRENTGQAVVVQRHGSTLKDGLRQFEPKSITIEELQAKKKNISQFLDNLDEQHKDKLIMDGVYLGLKNKYKHELTRINSQIKSIESKNIKKP